VTPRRSFWFTAPKVGARRHWRPSFPSQWRCCWNADCRPASPLTPSRASPRSAGVIDALRELYGDPRGYQTLIIDTLDSLEPMLLEHVCTEHHWKNIESPPYGKGFVIADQQWLRFIKAITALRNKHGMTVVLVAHSTIERFDDPRAPSYTAYWPKLHKRARHLILDACDLVGFLAEELHVNTSDTGFHTRARAVSTNQRFLFVEGQPAFVAKNRYSIPPKIAIPADFNIGELSKYWKAGDGNE